MVSFFFRFVRNKPTFKMKTFAEILDFVFSISTDYTVFYNSKTFIILIILNSGKRLSVRLKSEV